MSNTKQQNPPDPVEMLYIESPSITLKQFREAIDRLVTDARKPYVEILKLYGTPTCDSLHHPKGYNHSAFANCPVVDRIVELQSQLNKEEK